LQRQRARFAHLFSLGSKTMIDQLTRLLRSRDRQ
jgi:hypothetical protein